MPSRSRSHNWLRIAFDGSGHILVSPEIGLCPRSEPNRFRSSGRLFHIIRDTAIGVEIEELAVSRTQELSLSVSSDGGRTYRELVRQEFNFSPPGTSLERELWSVSAGGVTHLRLDIKPDKGDRAGRATLTSLTLA